MCKISRATTFIKFKKYVQNAYFELYIEKLQKIKSNQNYKMLSFDQSAYMIFTKKQQKKKKKLN